MIKKHPLVYCFFALLLVTTIIDMVNSDKKFSELENRNLKSKVEFTFKEYFLGRFQDDYEEYINDQFLNRDELIDLKSRSELLLGKVENNDIIYGEYDYLFEKVTSINKHRVDVNINSINKLSENINININITTIIAPNSYTIYDEYLPEFIPFIDAKKELEDVFSRLESDNNINMTSIMKENKDDYLYYKTDHHWTTYGAYLTYVEYIKSINKEPICLDDYKKNIVNDFYGTYYSKAKPFNQSFDEIVYYNFPGINMEISDNTYNTLYDYSKLNIRDKYSLFLYGNNPLTIVKNTNLNDGSKIIVFKDSYANSFIPFLTQNFEEVHVIDLRSFSTSVTQYINSNNFDQVLILYNFINFTRDADILKLKS